MFQKKCVVVGSLLVMAAQTATALMCDNVGNYPVWESPLCENDKRYTGELDEFGGGICANDPCEGANDVKTCCVAAANCDTLNAESNPTLATVCADADLYVQAVKGGDIYCTGKMPPHCQTSDAATCCEAKSTTPAPAPTPAPTPIPGPAPGAAAPGPAGDAENDAGSVAQCSTLAMLMVVAAMWAGRN